MPVNHVAAIVGFGSIQPDRPAMRVTVDLPLGQLHVGIGDSDEKIMLAALFEDVSDQGSGRTARTDDEEVLHDNCAYLEA